ncbi:LysR family transcriptional regulator [Paenibacillus sp. NPDC057934]|uniref:LysR family transcriptional regulator n=1 Tax=Paenibacillus sp. NPDC057934 TaxID=3346282 RepID=UPI0036D98EE0
MEIRHLITFTKIIEYGSYTLAAEHLGYTQSTITSHIQNLEAHVNAPLFNRIGRRMEVTETGNKLLRYANELLRTYEKIENIANEQSMTGELKIAAPESLTVYRLEPILREYRKSYPQVTIKLTNATCGDNKKALLAGEADLAFMMWPDLRETDLIVHTLLEEPIVLVGSSDHSLTTLDEQYHHQTLEECLIANEKDCSYRTMFEGYLRERGILPSHTMELWSIEAMKRCVSSGLGIACLPLVTVEKELEENSLKRIPCEGDFNKIHAHMVYHKNKWLSPALAQFIEITLEHAKGWSPHAV